MAACANSPPPPTFGIVLAVSPAACSSIPEDNAVLSQAHADYLSAQANPLTVSLAPAELKVAADALNKADAAYTRHDKRAEVDQLATSSACLRFHLIAPRLARWLLMSQDRAHSDSFRVTHEFLAFMLGARRVGTTSAAVGLQRAGLIQYHRGALSVLNRSGLEAAACSCYEDDRRAYAEAFGG